MGRHNKTLTPSQMEIDPLNSQAFRDVMAQVPTSVAVICTAAPGQRAHGFTVSSLTSLSLDPPLVSFNLRREAASLDQLRENKRFSINVLDRSQSALALHFAKAQADKFADVGWEKGAEDQPLLTGALARFECDLWQEYPGGDHSILIGHVRRMMCEMDRQPLIFHQGRFTGVSDIETKEYSL